MAMVAAAMAMAVEAMAMAVEAMAMVVVANNESAHPIYSQLTKSRPHRSSIPY